MSAGKIRAIDPALAREAHDYRLKERAIAATFFYYARRVLRQDPAFLREAGAPLAEAAK